MEKSYLAVEEMSPSFEKRKYILGMRFRLCNKTKSLYHLRKHVHFILKLK